MDDYITKPVRLEAVATVLERWIADPEPERGGAHVLATDARDPLDRSQIELLVSLDDGEGEVLGEIVEEYLVPSRSAPRSSSACS